MNLLDTSAWVEYFKGSKKGLAVKQIIANEVNYTSAITLAEISKWFYQNKADVETGINQIKANSVMIPLEESILVEAGKIIVDIRIKNKKFWLIDSIIYVSSILHGLDLITKDNDFRGLPKVKIL